MVLFYFGKAPSATIILVSDIGGERSGEMLCRMMAHVPNTR